MLKIWYLKREMDFWVLARLNNENPSYSLKVSYRKETNKNIGKKYNYCTVKKYATYKSHKNPEFRHLH